MKIWLLAVVLATGCHDASKDLEPLASRCKQCQDEQKAGKQTAEQAKACADKAIDELVTYIKANPNPVGNEQNAADQFKSLATCATELGVDVAARTKGL